MLRLSVYSLIAMLATFTLYAWTISQISAAVQRDPSAAVRLTCRTLATPDRYNFCISTWQTSGQLPG